MKTKKALLIDTTLKGSSIALLDWSMDCLPQTIASSYHFDVNGSAAVLPSLTKGLLERGRISFSDIDVIGVSTGPGSFTGIKVGLAFVKGLIRGQSKNIALFGLSSLEALAENSSVADCGCFFYLLPVTRDQGFIAFKSQNTVNLYIIEIGNEFEIYSEIDRKRVDVKILAGRSGIFLLPWARAEEKLTGIGVACSVTDYSLVAAEVIRAMSIALANSAAGEVSSLLPRYVKKSSPEELMNKHKERNGF